MLTAGRHPCKRRTSPLKFEVVLSNRRGQSCSRLCRRWRENDWNEGTLEKPSSRIPAVLFDGRASRDSGLRANAMERSIRQTAAIWSPRLVPARTRSNCKMQFYSCKLSTRILERAGFLKTLLFVDARRMKSQNPAIGHVNNLFYREKITARTTFVFFALVNALGYTQQAVF